jgi:hypothetical protein
MTAGAKTTAGTAKTARSTKAVRGTAKTASTAPVSRGTAKAASTTPASRSAPKTQPRAEGVEAYLGAIADPARAADCRALADLMARVTGQPAVMWGSAIVGFDRYRYRYDSGREGESCLLGFSSRSGEIAVYLMAGFDGAASILARLGKHRTAKACLYLKRLSEVDLGALEELLRHSAAETRRRHPG